MKVEKIGDREFRRSIEDNDGVWVLIAGSSLYLIETDENYALPTWKDAIEAQEFSAASELVGMKPIFANTQVMRNWLTNESMNVSEVLASPVYDSSALTYAASEVLGIIKT